MSRGFFPEIQALRAVAVCLVVVYHLQPAVLPGGFIGVDVFFVVSGYLITGHLLREHRASGTVRFGRFWAARARRILPAGLLCIALTVAAAYLVYPPTQWAQVGVQGVAASLSVLNWVLAADSVDYLASLDDPSPLQHFWSLGVEEQFYLVWPFVVVIGCVLANRLRSGPVVPALLFAVIAAASFTLGAVQVASGDPAAYFATTTRVWELVVGGVLALAVPRVALPGAARTALSLAGIGTVLVGALVISQGDPFPGVLALVPVLGASAVIAAGETSGVLAPARLYRARPVQWVGDASYSLYLWHFPPIVLFAVAAGHEPGPLATIGLAACTVAAAWASHRYIEQPARRSAWLAATPRRSLAVGAASIAVVCAVAATLPLAEQRVERGWVATATALDRAGAPGAAAMTSSADGYFPTGVVGVTPAPTRADQDESTVVAAGCTGVPRDHETPRCVIGAEDGAVSVALVGDSHAKQLATALDVIAKDRGWRVETYLHASCPFNTERRQVEAAGGVICQGPNRETLAALRADPPQIVFLTSWAAGDYVPTDTGHAPGVAGYAEMWNRLADAGSEVVVLKDLPAPSTQPIVPDCIAVHYDSPASCGSPREEAMDGRDIVDAAHELAPRAHVIDVTDRVCGETTCPAVVGNVLVYRDSNHVTDTFMRTLTPYIAAQLPDRLPGRSAPGAAAAAAR